MKTHFFLLLYLFSVLTASAQSRPNIIFILTDDLGYADLGCYGNPFNETPHIDTLAKNVIRFTQAYASSPVCSPSRAGILIGKHPARLQLTNFQGGMRTDSASNINPALWKQYLGSSEITLAERLKGLGYATGMIGKWHLGSRDSCQPWQQGFDYTRMITKNGLDYYNYEIAAEGFKTDFVDKGSTYLTDKLTEYAESFISSQKQPFFLYLCYSAPHIYLVPRGDKLKKYYSKYEKFNGKYNADYAAMIESVDDGVGRIVEALKKQNQLSNTIIIFTSDNGGVGLPELGPVPTSAGNLRKWKGHVYEGGIRIPAIFYFPRLTNGSRTVDNYFCNLDYTATIGELLQANFATPDGKSFLPLLKNDTSFDRGMLYWHYPHFSNQMGRPAAAIRDGNYKLVYWFETEKTELFNLKTDPSEKTPLNAQQKAIEKRLKTALFDWMKVVNASLPVKKNY